MTEEQLQELYIKNGHDKLEIFEYPTKRKRTFPTLQGMHQYFEKENKQWDALFLYVSKNNIESNSIVLQSLTNLRQILSYLKGYGNYSRNIPNVLKNISNNHIFSSTSHAKLVLGWFDKYNKQAAMCYVLLLGKDYKTTEAQRLFEVKQSIYLKDKGKSINELVLKEDFAIKSAEQLDSQRLKYEKIIDILKKESEFNNNEFVERGELLLSEQTLKLDKRISDFEVMVKSQTEKLNSLNKSYDDLLRLKEPIKYWESVIKEYEKRKETYLGGILIALVVLIVLIISYSIYLSVSLTKDSSAIELLKLSIPMFTIITLGTYGFSQLIKLYMSAEHLRVDASERLQLTRVYLSLGKDGKINSEKDRQTILNALFSRVETGLLKHDASPTIPSGIISLLTK